MRRAVCERKFDLSGDSPWSRQLTAIRTEVSDVLKAEIEATPGRVRRLLRPRPAKEIVPGSQLDATDVSEAEMMVEFVGACRTYAHELAVNEMTMRIYTELQNYLETGTKVLLEGCAKPATPTGRSGSRRWTPRFASAAPSSAPTMRVSLEKPPKLRFKPRVSTANRREPDRRPRAS